MPQSLAKKHAMFTTTGSEVTNAQSTAHTERRVSASERLGWRALRLA